MSIAEEDWQSIEFPETIRKVNIGRETKCSLPISCLRASFQLLTKDKHLLRAIRMLLNG